MDHKNIFPADQDSFCQELSVRGLGFVVCSPFGSLVYCFFMCVYWGSNPAVDYFFCVTLFVLTIPTLFRANFHSCPREITSPMLKLVFTQKNLQQIFSLPDLTWTVLTPCPLPETYCHPFVFLVRLRVKKCTMRLLDYLSLTSRLQQ